MPIALVLSGALAGRADQRARRRPPRVPWLVISALLVTYVGLILFVLPALEQRKVVPDVAQWVAEAGAAGRSRRQLPAEPLDARRIRFYVGRHTTFLEDAEEADAFFSDRRSRSTA